jgi:hypothetical protein
MAERDRRHRDRRRRNDETTTVWATRMATAAADTINEEWGDLTNR